MRVKVKIHPGSSREKVLRVGDSYEVWVKERAENDKANFGLIKILKKYFKKDIKIKSGFTSKNKMIEVLK